MSRLIKTTTCLILFAVLFITACNNSIPSGTHAEASSPATDVITPSSTSEVLPSSRVEVVYFHMPWRCGTCICFEERVGEVIHTYFQDELASGRLNLTICDLSDGEKAALIRKYDAFASQLFITTVVNNTENRKNIEDIWNWHCEKDPQGFDAKIKYLIDQALNEIG